MNKYLFFALLPIILIGCNRNTSQAPQASALLNHKANGSREGIAPKTIKTDGVITAPSILLGNNLYVPVCEFERKVEGNLEGIKVKHPHSQFSECFLQVFNPDTLQSHGKILIEVEPERVIAVENFLYVFTKTPDRLLKVSVVDPNKKENYTVGEIVLGDKSFTQGARSNYDLRQEPPLLVNKVLYVALYYVGKRTVASLDITHHRLIDFIPGARLVERGDKLIGLIDSGGVFTYKCKVERGQIQDGKKPKFCADALESPFVLLAKPYLYMLGTSSATYTPWKVQPEDLNNRGELSKRYNWKSIEGCSSPYGICGLGDYRPTLPAFWKNRIYISRLVQRSIPPYKGAITIIDTAHNSLIWHKDTFIEPSPPMVSPEGIYVLSKPETPNKGIIVNLFTANTNEPVTLFVPMKEDIFPQFPPFVIGKKLYLQGIRTLTQIDVSPWLSEKINNAT